MTYIYFLSGMGASCKVFDKIKLPETYQKIYLEWRLPHKDENLEKYAQSYSLLVNNKEPFILIGYSFGGILVQEMTKFLKPNKLILIASIKDLKQKPRIFSFFKKIHVEKAVKSWLFNDKLTLWIFKNFIYKTKEEINIQDFLPQLNATYMRWAIKEILMWEPSTTHENIYQIHGEKDLTFPYRKIKSHKTQKLYTMPNSGHLLVLEKPDEVSVILKNILLNS